MCFLIIFDDYSIILISPMFDVAQSFYPVQCFTHLVFERLEGWLCRLLSGIPFSLPLCIYFRREWVLKPSSNSIRPPNQRRQRHASRLPAPQRGAQETERGAVVHGRVGHVKGERGHGRVHEDPKVVAEVGARHSESVHAADDEDVAAEEEAIG